MFDAHTFDKPVFLRKIILLLSVILENFPVCMT
ncbi:hypothetical protein AFAE65S_01745 [Alcaligenes phenolicus]|jgi:hypothetical protein|nr:Uncharacterised protein [Alcaligenes faecalis subsp. faecalis]